MQTSSCPWWVHALLSGGFFAHSRPCNKVGVRQVNSNQHRYPHESIFCDRLGYRPRNLGAQAQLGPLSRRTLLFSVLSAALRRVVDDLLQAPAPWSVHHTSRRVSIIEPRDDPDLVSDLSLANVSWKNQLHGHNAYVAGTLVFIL
jgi:hypothetical protein